MIITATYDDCSRYGRPLLTVTPHKTVWPADLITLTTINSSTIQVTGPLAISNSGQVYRHNLRETTAHRIFTRAHSNTLLHFDQKLRYRL